jgi:chromosome segregation ATPase
VQQSIKANATKENLHVKQLESEIISLRLLLSERDALVETSQQKISDLQAIVAQLESDVGKAEKVRTELVATKSKVRVSF